MIVMPASDKKLSSLGNIIITYYNFKNIISSVVLVLSVLAALCNAGARDKTPQRPRAWPSSPSLAQICPCLVTLHIGLQRGLCMNH